MRLSYLLPTLLVASFAAQAQTQTGIATGGTITDDATPYQIQRDSLWGRAGRIRSRVNRSISSFSPRYIGLGGVSRRVRSYADPQQVIMPTITGLLPLPSSRSAQRVLVKRQVVKHKTHNARVEKVYYYGAGHNLLLYEYHEDGALAQLELYDYPLVTGSGSNTFVTMRWVRGNYLRVSQRASTGTGGSLMQYQVYAEPEPLPR